MGRALPLAVLIVIASRSDARAQCRPAAIPSGEPTLVQRLAERLAASGIATTTTDGCPIARVRVEQRGEQIRLEITDRYGRTGMREVRDVATAATIVESWTSQEIEAGSLPALAESAPAPAIATVAPAAGWSYGVVAAFASSAGSDGSIWLGGAVSSCVRIRSLCAGGLVRAARDARTADSTIDHDTTAIDALATVSLPRRVGGFTITPGVGLGYGWQRLTEHHFDAMHMVPIDVARSGHGLRGDLHLAIARPIGMHLAIYADVRGDAALARTDSTTGPAAFLHASLGVRVGME